MTQQELHARISKQITENPIMLYMKGDRLFPQCGFSARVVDILEACGVEFQTHDVLSDPELRAGMKDFSQWPTFPQLFIRGELVGGCDIVTSLYQSGDLTKLFEDQKIPSKASGEHS